MSGMGRHRAVSDRFRWRWLSARVVVPVPRLPGIEVVDVQTGTAHRVNPDELVAGCQRGACQGLCGARFRPASLVEPARGHCPGCVS